MNSAITCTVDTPVGPFTVIVADSDAQEPAVLASGWTAENAALMTVIAPALRPVTLSTVVRVEDITDAVEAYHEGELTAIDAVRVRQISGPFLLHAWDVLRTVEAGKPITYSEFAALSGRPPAIRAAASACARNAVALFVPCHRVLRLDGSLGGFRWGLVIKQWLLDHERAGQVEAA